MRTAVIVALVFIAGAVFARATDNRPRVVEEREPAGIGNIKSLRVVDDQGKTRITISANGGNLVIR